MSWTGPLPAVASSNWVEALEKADKIREALTITRAKPERRESPDRIE